MSPTDDIDAAQSALADLRRAVIRLHSHYGETVDVHRLRDDVARASADLTLLQRSAPRSTGAAGEEVVNISDDDYGREFWADAEDEGLGAPGRR